MTDRPQRMTSHEGFPSAEAERLFHAHTGLADRLARRYSFGPGIDDDMRQAAHLGLLLACRRFDPERGVFTRFATVTVIGELKKHLRAHGWAVRVPRQLQEDSVAVARATEALTASLGRAPTVGEVAARTGFVPERVAEAIRTTEARFSSSIEHQALDVASSSDESDAALLHVALDRLPADQRQLIHYRHERGLTQAEIGRLLGVSQPQVHRRLHAAMRALREQLETTCS